MPQFHVDSASIKDGFVLLDKKETRHALSVLRLKEGQVLELFDGMGNAYRGIFSSVQDGRMLVMIDQTKLSKDSDDRLIDLAVSVIKPERMELLIEKASELGAHSIIPLITERCVIKLSPERWQAKSIRWKKIALESCKQCGRSRVPDIHEVTLYKNFIKSTQDYDEIFLATLAVKTEPLFQVLKASKSKKILVLIGPEGDFTPSEVELAISQGARAVTLGPLVLRSETAAMYILSVLSFFYREAS